MRSIHLLSAFLIAPVASTGAINLSNETSIVKKASELDMSPEWNNFPNDYIPITTNDKYYQTNEGVSNRISFQIFLTPNNDTRFQIEEIRSGNSYYLYSISLPFKIHTSLILYYRDTNRNVWVQQEILQSESILKTYSKDFKGYVLPKYDKGNTYDLLAYILKGNIKIYISSNELGFILGDLKQEEYSLDYIENNYVWNWLNTKNYDFDNYFAASDLAIDYSNSYWKQEYINFFKEKYSFSESFQDITLDFTYNSSINNTNTAWKDGYNNGRELQNTPVGLEWVKGAAKTLESFLNLNFGFFNLGQLLGGVIVIVIVLWILRRFI